MAITVQYNDVYKEKFDTKEKFDKKVKMIENACYGRIPQEWQNDFFEYSVWNFDKNENIYFGYSPEQFNVIKQYFRWRTRGMFNASSIGSRKLRPKPMNQNKEEKLAKIMGMADDWIFDGTIDTGWKGESHCTLGHPLRYEHYAYSPSINRYVKFGSTCMSDFFQVDVELIREIQNNQEEMINQMKIVTFVLNTGKLEKYKELYYKDIEELYDIYGPQGIDKLAKEEKWQSYMGTFYMKGIPLPYMMINILKDARKHAKFMSELKAVLAKADVTSAEINALKKQPMKTKLEHALCYNIFYIKEIDPQFLLPALISYKVMAENRSMLFSKTTPEQLVKKIEYGKKYGNIFSDLVIPRNFLTECIMYDRQQPGSSSYYTRGFKNFEKSKFKQYINEIQNGNMKKFIEELEK